jgi:hypothetical protein
MPRLYRSPRDLQHWFVFDDAVGWMCFPARIGGWAERRTVRTVSGLELREVPLWLSFNTGLEADRRVRRLHLAA